MSVLTKKKKKTFKFLSPVAAVAWEENVYKLYDINCSTQPQAA